MNQEDHDNLITLMEQVKEIKENHLVHLAAQQDRLYWLILTTLLSVVVTRLL